MTNCWPRLWPHALPQHAGGNIGGRAGNEADDQPDRAVWIVALGQCRGEAREQETCDRKAKPLCCAHCSIPSRLLICAHVLRPAAWASVAALTASRNGAS